MGAEAVIQITLPCAQGNVVVTPWCSAGVREISELHGKSAIHVNNFHRIVDGMNFDEAHGAGFGLDRSEDIVIAIDEQEAALVFRTISFPFLRRHAVNVGQGLVFARPSTVEDDYDLLSVRPRVKFASSNLLQLHRRDIFDAVVSINHDGGMVGKAGSQQEEQNSEN